MATATYSAREYLIMTTPYFVPSDDLLHAICTAAQRGVVDDVVVDQGRGVDVLDHRGVGDLLLRVVPQEAGGEQEEGRAQALAPRGDDVARHLPHQRDAGLEAAGDDGIHLPHVVCDQGKYGGGAG